MGIVKTQGNKGNKGNNRMNKGFEHVALMKMQKATRATIEINPKYVAHVAQVEKKRQQPETL